MAKEAYYFSHDSNARHDPKIAKMLCKYKYGYQWFFMIVEILREQSDFKYKIDEYCFPALAKELDEPREKIEEFVKDCINEFNLFKTDNISFWSDSLLRRMKKKAQKSRKYAENAKIRWRNEKKKRDAMALQSQSNGIAGKEIKGKEIKGNIYSLPEQIHLLFIKTFGKNPNTMEVEAIEKLINQFTYPVVEKAVKDGVYDGCRKLKTLIGRINESGEYVPFETEKKEEGIVIEHVT